MKTSVQAPEMRGCPGGQCSARRRCPSRAGAASQCLQVVASTAALSMDLQDKLEVCQRLPVPVHIPTDQTARTAHIQFLLSAVENLDTVVQTGVATSLLTATTPVNMYLRRPTTTATAPRLLPNTASSSLGRIAASSAAHATCCSSSSMLLGSICSTMRSCPVTAVYTLVQRILAVEVHLHASASKNLQAFSGRVLFATLASANAAFRAFCTFCALHRNNVLRRVKPYLS